jgi:hypothetical protein
VIDTGLPFNWRAYLPEERIAVEFARSFGGGGGNRGTVSSQPEKWERDTNGHGIAVTSVILGFRYNLSDPPLPATFNGVAPKATVIPVKKDGEPGLAWSSAIARAIVYLTDLKANGQLGNSPLVINMSFGGFPPPEAQTTSCSAQPLTMQSPMVLFQWPAPAMKRTRVCAFQGGTRP